MADAAESGKSEQDDVSFLRTDDNICLTCVTPTSKDSQNVERVCLGAEGFGNRMCYLENLSSKHVPPDLSMCMFVLEQALSVRALQEMVTSTSQDMATQSGHRTLLYGHAVLLKHANSSMYLSCLSTSSSNDKLAFDVGLTETPQGESCWWTIHPASKQRSEGEKVRVGDDLILVSVASERYLHIGSGQSVIASFQQTLWTVAPVCSGAIRQKSLGFVFGGDVLRLFHGHMDECLTIPPAGSENEFSAVMYEVGAVCTHARSLWRLEHIRTKWAGGFMGWAHPCRFRHVTSGRYLGLTADNQVTMLHRDDASDETTAFFLRQSKDDRKHSEAREDEGMGTADIKYGDSIVFLQHCQTGLWLSYQTFETKKKGVGRVEEKKAVMLVEGHMDDGLSFVRAQEEESRSARVIRKCQSLFHRFIKALDALKTEGRSNPSWQRVNLSEVIKCLEDLIEYFAQPQENEEHEEKQLKLKALRNRQDLFQEEGMIALILSTIDNFSRFHSRRHFANYAGEEAANTYEDISGYLYLLLAAMIRGNRANCAQFADCNRLDWLVNRLESQQSSQGVLEVLHCVLIDSPEALNMIKEQHIRTIISLIDKHGRDPKVLNVLCSLCVGNGVAVRSNQNLICDNLLPTRDLLLQSQLVDHVSSMHPNVYVGLQEGSAMYKKWYFEIAVEYVETVTHLHPHIRVGWANTTGFCPFPAGGDRYGANGVGDDLYSYGFDGGSLWTAGKPKTVRLTSQYLVKGDIIGCALDLTIPKISFTVNGVRVKGFFKDFNLEGLFYPVVSLSAKVSCRFMLGGEHGRLKHGPPEDHAPISEALLPREKLKIQPSFHFGNIPKGVLCGPSEIQSYTFVPNPVDTSQIQLPTYIENVRDRLAENIHELWAMGKIEQGWISGEMRDDQRKIHPCLTTFERLPAAERKYDITLAYETLRTLLALGYHITIASPDQIPRLKTLKLPNNYLQSSGYKPTPLDLSGIVLDDRMHDLVELLAENTHNVWARDRIKQGWTYGLAEDSKNRRSPHLIPYAKVDEAIKRANRETASETVRTLIAYGYNLEPPTNEGGEGGLANEMTTKKQATRTYRGQLTYAVTSGKWYYEFEVITPGYMRVGWTKVSCKPDAEIGEDDKSYAFDGYMARKWHNGSEAYGKTWQAGDVIGCMLDIPDRTISFSLNGEAMMDPMGQEIAFKDIDVSEGYVPVFTLGQSQQAKLNFGQDVNSLKYFTCCGLQEGYEPFCVNMTKQMTLWYSQDNPIFMPVPKDHHRIGVSRMPGGSNTPPCLKVVSKNYGTLEKVQLEFIKLNLPIKCHDEFRPRIEAKMNFENLRRGQMDISEEQGLTNGYKDGESAHKVIADSLRRLLYSSSRENSLDKRNGLKNYSSESDDRRQSKMSESASSGTELQRGYTEDYSIDAGERRKVFGGSRGGKPHSLDSSLGSPVSDMELEDSMLTVPTSKEKSSSKFSLLENFQDASRQISSLEKPTKRSKSPFSLFKKSRSRDPSPSERGDKKKDKKSRTLPSKVGRGDSMDDSLVTPSINIQEHRDDAGYPGLSLQKSFSEVSYGSDADSQSEVMDPDINVSEVFDYYYGVRVFPGQDPSHVWVGWVTSGYHFHQKEFQMKKVRNVVVCTLDADYHLKTSVSRKNCYMVSAGDLQQRYGQQEQTAGLRRVSPGLLIGSFIDASTGLLSFTVNGKEVANKFQVCDI
ncbi:ryanodine receptor [Lingula anatina]|uniref:Ryanodine receptor n=1 Tax=Lingula anatina TaxID=7574 RepID=A0A1S3I1E5_LINAN|nr:ryanodine receptor [Lingula anatina]|eukprot:XP_013392082.1 ryanodine receptor [Lingula anatina]